MPPYSMDLRQRVLSDCDAGLETAAVAQKYTVSPAWVRRLKQRRRETGETAPRQQRHGRPCGRAAYAEALRQAIQAEPDATLAELRERLQLRVSLTTLWRAVADLGLTVKKK
jgi:transposase